MNAHLRQILGRGFYGRTKEKEKKIVGLPFLSDTPSFELTFEDRDTQMTESHSALISQGDASVSDRRWILLLLLWFVVVFWLAARRVPAGFAWPAGLGDIAMAATAPWIAARVAADDRFRFGKTFLAWNLFGIADFLDAVLLGTLYLRPGFTSGVTTSLMQLLPFALIPCFFVPLVAIARSILLERRRAS